MAQPNQPRAAFAVGVTAADYAAAARVASRRSGQLRDTRWGVAFCAVFTLSVAWLCLDRPLAAAVVAVCGAAVCGGILWLARRAVNKAAAKDYATYAALFAPTTVTLWEDWMELAGPHFARREPYALLAELVETPAQFVFLQKDGRFLVLPKRDIPADGGRILEFLRTTFARKYSRARW